MRKGKQGGLKLSKNKLEKGSKKTRRMNEWMNEEDKTRDKREE